MAIRGFAVLLGLTISATMASADEIGKIVKLRGCPLKEIEPRCWSLNLYDISAARHHPRIHDREIKLRGRIVSIEPTYCRLSPVLDQIHWRRLSTRCR